MASLSHHWPVLIRDRNILLRGRIVLGELTGDAEHDGVGGGVGAVSG